jgi:hypothetical protein
VKQKTRKEFTVALILCLILDKYPTVQLADVILLVDFNFLESNVWQKIRDISTVLSYLPEFEAKFPESFKNLDSDDFRMDGERYYRFEYIDENV